MAKTTYKQKGNPALAYFGFMFQTFLKRPFGYVVAILYAVYLAVILLIVPAALHFGPLFIWNSAAFNIPIFNLIFLSAAASALAVSIFRTGIEDGTELSLSSKPLTKGEMVAVKTTVYLIIMFLFSLVTIAIAALTKPIFGDALLTGITTQKYRGLLLSLLVGNAVISLFFGAVAVFISMIGGQVIIMVATIGLAFLMCLANVIFPITVSGPLEVLRDKYSTSINSIAAPTMSQYNSTTPSKNISFAGIQCITDDEFNELNHMDTSEYWKKATSDSGFNTTNYFDFGKQLSNLYNSFGLDETKNEAAQKLAIGVSTSSNYTIDETTHVKDWLNIQTDNLPFITYSQTVDRGILIPIVSIFGGNTGLDVNNWGAVSKLAKIDFDSVITITTRPNSLISDPMRLLRKERQNIFGQYYWKMSDLILTEAQEKVAENAFKSLLDNAKQANSQYSDPIGVSASDTKSAIRIIVDTLDDDTSKAFYEGKWDDQKPLVKVLTIAKIQLNWIKRATQYQRDQIDAFIKGADTFPYSSKTVISWIKSLDETGLAKQQVTNKIINRGIDLTIHIKLPETLVEDDYTWYVKPINSNIQYCETFNNMYQYKVKSFYNIYALIGAWSAISVALFTGSVIVYKKTDFK